MPASRSFVPGVLLAWFALVAIPAQACRYSVRDTGFVDFDQLPWLLRLSGVPEDARAAWHDAARARLRDSNLRLDSDAAPTSGPAQLELIDPARRRLALTDEASPLPATPAAIGEFLERLALSETRDQLHDAMLRAFAVVFLVEGTDASRTAAAREIAAAAIREFTPLLRSLPKPVDQPPELVVLPVARLAVERVLAWSLGFAPEPTPEPRVVVLYGRGRRAGQPLEGPLVTRTALAERLALIGQDCECDLERSLLQGPVFPARWDSTRQAAAAKRLGFDPENPLVRTEVSRIVLRGPAPGQARRSPTSAFDTLALGYSEEPVHPTPEATVAPDFPASNPSSNTMPAPASADPAPTPATYWYAFLGVASLALLTGAWILVRAFRSR